MSRLFARRTSGDGSKSLSVAPKLQMLDSMKLNGGLDDPHAQLTALHAKYTVTSEILGSGTSAVVKRATRKDNPDAEVAVKFVNTRKDEGLCEIIQREFELIKELHHPSIVEAYEFFMAPDRTLVALCMELVRGSTLKALVQKSGAVTEGMMRPLFKQLILGLRYLHSKRVIHRDLKPDNLLIKEKLDGLQICDFNVACKLVKGGSLTPVIADMHFSAPEVLLCDGKMGEKSDIWGSGVCLYYALSGGMTFASISRVEHYSTLRLGEFLLNVSDKERLKWIEKPGLSWDSPAVNVLWGCTHSDISKRPEPSLLLAHPWLSRIGDGTGQEYAENVRNGLPADAMETCAIRVCSIGYRADCNYAMWQSSIREDKTLKTNSSFHFTTFQQLKDLCTGPDSECDETITTPKIGFDKKKHLSAPNFFWTAPPVDEIRLDDLLAASPSRVAHSVILSQCDGTSGNNTPSNRGNNTPSNSLGRIASPSGTPSNRRSQFNSNDPYKHASQEKAIVEQIDSPVANSSATFALSNVESDSRARVLDLYAPDQEGLLSVLCEALMANSLDVEHAQLDTINGVVRNRILFHVPIDDTEAQDSIKGLEDAVKSMCQALANREAVCDFAMQKTLQHYVNPDLLRVTSFHEIPSNDSQLRYEVGLQGIDQAGILAYVSVLFARCRFSIAKAFISTKYGHISDVFELTANSTKAVDLLRSQLDLPGDNQFCEEDLNSLPFNRLNSVPSHNADELSEEKAEGNLESTEIMSVVFPNGDEYQGGTKNQDRHGYGVYKYYKKSRLKQYKGQWQNGMKHGYGVLMYRNGDVYAGQWEENTKKGVGILFQCSGSDPQGLPTSKYEGQWLDDFPNGHGVQESQDALYYGWFTNGERSGPGVDLKYNKINECKVLNGGEQLSLIETLPSTRSRYMERATGDACAISCSRQDTESNDIVDQQSSCPPIRESKSDDATPMQTQNLKLFSLRSTPGNSLVQTPKPTATATLQLPKMTPHACQDHTPLQKELATPKVLEPSRRLDALDLNSLPPRTSVTLENEGSQPAVQRAETAVPESNQAESSAFTKWPVRCPTLWAEHELAAFVSCLGISESMTNAICEHQIKGPAQLLERSNRDLHSLGLTDPVQRLVVRKALQRLLEIDRFENIFVGQRIGDVSNPVLCSHIIPLEDITISSTISQGGYGKVFRGTLRPCGKSNDPKRQKIRDIAIKEMKGARQKIQLHELLKEAHVLASLHHKNICRFLGVCANKSPEGKRYIISELLNCSLFDLIHRPQKLRWHGELTLALANSLSIDICAGIAYLHNKKLVHADLKSSNILVDFSATPILPKICDFGHAAIRPSPAPHNRCGTPHWAAPEALRGEALGEAADMYSFGVIFWEMLTKQIPHHDLSTCQVLATVGWAGFSVDLDLIKYSPESMQHVIEECLANMPSRRPTAKTTKQRLRRVKEDVKVDVFRMLSEFFGS